MSMYDVSLLNSLSERKHNLPANWTVRPLQLSDYNKGKYGLSVWWRGLGLLKKSGFSSTSVPMHEGHQVKKIVKFLKDNIFF